VLWLQKSAVTANAFERLRPLKETGHLPVKSRVIGLEFIASAVRGDREIKAAELAASLDINLPLGSPMIC
jgi:hypothetical protein